MGTVKSTAASQSFSMLAYALPLFFGYLADTRTGRFKLICWGVVVCGLAHVLMVVAGAKNLLANENAKIPYFLSVYILAIGAGKQSPRAYILELIIPSHVQTEHFSHAPRSNEAKRACY